MSRASAARAKRRAAKRVGAVLVDSVSIAAGALIAAEAKGADRVDFIAFHIVNALTRLDAAGGDIEAHTVVTIGEHPDYPGDLTIEAKVSKLRPIPETPEGDRLRGATQSAELVRSEVPVPDERDDAGS